MGARKDTVRLLFAEWQGGDRPQYSFAPNFLQWLAPKGPSTEVIRVPVACDFSGDRGVRGGIVWPDALIAQQRAAARILAERRPRRVVTFGGDCSVSQAPFDYLHGQYPHDLGILWIDTHPDITTPAHMDHEHAMVLGNLLKDGAPELASLIEHPFSHEDVLFVGLRHDQMAPWELDYVDGRHMAYVTPEQLERDDSPVLDWVRAHGYGHLAIHFDIDALSPASFLQQYPNNPNEDFGDVPVGGMTLTQVAGLLAKVAQLADIVGLTIAEFLAWDLISLRENLARIDILAR